MPWYKDALRLEASRLSEESKTFADLIFERFPQLKTHACMYRANEEGRFDLVIKVDSPTKDESRRLVLWYDYGCKLPSLGFGPWHTHGTLQEELEGPRPKMPNSSLLRQDATLLEFVEAIFQDRIVVVEQLNADPPMTDQVVDLASQDELQAELAAPFGTGQLKIKSWTGEEDQVRTL